MVTSESFAQKAIPDSEKLTIRNERSDLNITCCAMIATIPAKPSLWTMYFGLGEPYVTLESHSGTYKDAQLFKRSNFSGTVNI